MRCLIEVRNSSGRLIDSWIGTEGTDIGMRDAQRFYGGLNFAISVTPF